MLVIAEATPNPLTLKFRPGREVMPGGTAEFRKGQDGALPALASAILDIPGTSSVLLGHDFVSVTSDGRPWAYLKDSVSAVIGAHFIGNPIPTAVEETSLTAVDPNAVATRIKDLLDSRVRPHLASDGGDVRYVDYRDNVLFLSMHGACNGCPSSSATLRHVILGAMRRWLPEIADVRLA